MKKLTLMSLVVVIMMLLITPNYTTAQSSCVQFPEPPVLVQIAPGVYRVVIHNYFNPTSGAKTFNVQVKNWMTNASCFQECVFVQGNTTTDYESVDIFCDNPTWIVIAWTGNAQQACSGTACTTLSSLPVIFTAFSATRNNANVSLTWTTALEVDNRGFSVEKQTSGSGWKEVSFVNSKSANGNSSSQLSYSYTDLNNNEKGITQYRIKQIDLNGKFEYTDISAVRGEGQESKVIIYPNPGINGKVSVSFTDNASRNIQLVNSNGQTIKSYNNFMDNNLIFENLKPGLYFLNVITSAGSESTEKIMIQ